MKSTNIFVLTTALLLTLALTACTGSPVQAVVSASQPQSGETSAPFSQAAGQIYLYGEQHGIKKILDGEIELWNGYYHNENMRHLFIESPYYTAEFLNQWMQSENDDILDALYNDWTGSASHNPDVKEFYKQIKLQCPETVFHGTDVGHQYDTTGERFLQFLRDKKQEDTEQYRRAQEVMEQGKYFYEHDDFAYRENKMVENFIYAYDGLRGENVMGIYGVAHTGLEAMEFSTGSIPCMANQLGEHYGAAIHSEDLSGLAKVTEPRRVDVMQVDGREYQASYFGKENITGFQDYASREFWRLENAYDDFKNRPKPGDCLPYNNYPMLVESGQVFVIDYTKTDGSVIRSYYRSDEGYLWEGMPSTEAFTLE